MSYYYDIHNYDTGHDMSKLFPLSIASGASFCNRVEERQWLADNIENCQHSLLLSPRRYGKTSLATQVIKDGKYLYAKFDLLLISDEVTIQEEILNGVAKLVASLLPFHKRAYEKVKKFMSGLGPEVSFGETGTKVSFNPKKSPRINITESLEQLDKFAAAEGKRVVLLMDEFQQIASINNNVAIEAAIRHAAERTESSCYLFLGSNQHTLAEMFQDRARPLYHLCEEMHLQRIGVAHYEPFLQKAAKKQWQKKLADGALALILALTKRHPYYVNLLCSRLWRQEKVPTEAVVNKLWHAYCDEQRPRVASELGQLSPNQRAVIRALAKWPTTMPTGKDFQQKKCGCRMRAWCKHLKCCGKRI